MEVNLLIKIKIFFFNKHWRNRIFFVWVQMTLGILKTSGANIVLAEISCGAKGRIFFFAAAALDLCLFSIFSLFSLFALIIDSLSSFSNTMLYMFFCHYILCVL